MGGIYLSIPPSWTGAPTNKETSCWGESACLECFEANIWCPRVLVSIFDVLVSIFGVIVSIFVILVFRI